MISYMYLHRCCSVYIDNDKKSKEAAAQQAIVDKWLSALARGSSTGMYQELRSKHVASGICAGLAQANTGLIQLPGVVRCWWRSRCVGNVRCLVPSLFYVRVVSCRSCCQKRKLQKYANSVIINEKSTNLCTRVLV